jgi:homoserine kinase type II
MAEWRKLAETDVRAILRDFGLDGYRAHHPIAVGTINTNVRVETEAGPLFLRVNEGKSLDDVGREAAIVAHVAARGVPTPVPLASGAGQPFVLWRDQIVSLFPWIPGRTLERAEVTPADAAAVGRALAQLHLAGADFADHRPGRYEPSEIERRLAGVADLNRAELVPAVTVLSAELGSLAKERAGALPAGVVHGDLFIDNVLYADGALAALLDFEQASWGRLAYDLAVTVLAFGFGGDDFRADVTRALLDAYTAVRAPAPEERAALGPELRFAACRFAVTRLTDVHLKQGAGAAPGKRYQRYLARLASLQIHLATDHLFSL